MAKTRKKIIKSDTYGRDQARLVGQVRCRIKWCNARVWRDTAEQYADEKGYRCPSCADQAEERKRNKESA